MFILSALEEEIRVQPSDLHKTPLEAVTEAIEQRYIDKVIPDLGLVVTLYDIQSIEGGFIYPSDGAAFFKTKFRVVVFRPFVGEIIVGKLKSCSREGLKVSLDFFHDIFVPEHALQEPSLYVEAEKLWMWQFDGKQRRTHPAQRGRAARHAEAYRAQGAVAQQTARLHPVQQVACGAAHCVLVSAPHYAGNEMYMDLDESIVVRVTAVRFPKPPTALEMEKAGTDELVIGTEAKPFVPMEVLADINGDGLGMTAWWAPPEEEAEG